VGQDSPVDTNDVKQAAARAGDHPVVENIARLGYAVSGILHLLIGWLALQVAWVGGSGGSADQSGALQTLSGNEVGKVILWIAVVGFIGLGLWNVIEVIVGRGQTSDRVKSGAKAVVYLFLGVSAFTYARSGGSGSSSSSQTVDFTATLMSQPAGKILVGAVGLAVIGVGIYHVVKGARKKFLQDLREHPGQWVVRAGVFGYIAKGIALGVVARCSSWPPCGTSPASRPVSTVRCARCVTRHWDSGCSRSSRSGSPATRSTPSAAPGTPASERVAR
jgi:hypothetical protein